MKLAVLNGLNEAGLRFVGERQCEYDDPLHGRCENIVKPAAGRTYDSPYDRICTECMIYVFGKGE